MSVNSLPTLMPITTRPEQVMVRGEGSFVWDDNEKRYLDFIQGWAVNALGHCPKALCDALTAQANTLITPSPALHNAPQLALADCVVKASGLHQVHFANSGAEANEAAVKLSRKWGQQHRNGAFEILTTTNAFHGRTLAMMSASGKPGWDTLFAPMPTGFKHVPFGDAHAMRAAVGKNTLAIMVEPIQGEAGVIVPPRGYLRELAAIAKDHNLLLILDEVQTGVGRTGKLFGFQHADVTPDIMTLGKGLGGGVPISAMVAAEHVCCFEGGDQGGTYNGNPLMCAAALAVFETVMTPAFLQRVVDASTRLRAGLDSLGKEHGIIEVRGQGLLLAARLNAARANDVQTAAFDAGLLLNAPREDTLRFMPSLVVSDDEVDHALAILGRVLRETA